MSRYAVGTEKRKVIPRPPKGNPVKVRSEPDGGERSLSSRLRSGEGGAAVTQPERGTLTRAPERADASF